MKNIRPLWSTVLLVLLYSRNAKAHFDLILILCFVCPGMEDYLQRYSEGIKRVLNTFGPVPDFSGEPAARIIKVCNINYIINNWNISVSFKVLNRIFQIFLNIIFFVFIINWKILPSTLGDLWVDPCWTGAPYSQEREKGSAADGTS